MIYIFVINFTLFIIVLLKLLRGKTSMVYLFLVNFILAVSTTISMSVSPILFTEVAGIGLFLYGVIEGGAELLSNVIRVFSGAIYDKIKSKKLLFISASYIALISKMLLCFFSAPFIVASKILERVANGIFAVPRDCYTIENTKSDQKGLNIAIMNTFKTLGCVLAPVWLSSFVLSYGGLYEALDNILIAVIILNIVAVVLCFKIPSRGLIEELKSVNKFSLKNFTMDDFNSIKYPLAFIIIFFLARFNDGQIVVYLKAAGYPETFYLSTIAIFNFVMFVSAILLGMIIDRGHVITICAVAVFSLVIFNLINIFYYNAYSIVAMSVALAFWGIQRIAIQILIPILILNASNNDSKGLNLGVCYVLSGVSFFVASSFNSFLASYSYNLLFCNSLVVSLFALVFLFLFSPRIYR